MSTLSNGFYIVLFTLIWLCFSQVDLSYLHLSFGWVLTITCAIGMYLALDKSPQGKWLLSVELACRWVFLLGSAVGTAWVVARYADADMELYLLAWMVYVMINAVWGGVVQDYWVDVPHWKKHIAKIRKHGDFSPLHIKIQSIDVSKLGWLTFELCMFLNGFYWLISRVRWSGKELLIQVVVWFFLVLVGAALYFTCCRRKNALLMWRLRQIIGEEFLEINAQGLRWQIVLNRAPTQWQKEVHPEIGIDKEEIGWETLQSIQILEEGVGRQSIRYVLIKAQHKYAPYPISLRIDEFKTAYSVAELHQLLLQYHNLGMKPFHTVGNPSKTSGL